MIITTNLKLAELKNPPDLCLTAKTGMGSCAPNRKRHWKNLALNCLIRVSPRANTTIENKPLMQYAARCSLTSAAKHGVHLEQEPSYGGRAYLEKQDYILMKQKEQLAAQEQKLEELTLKIEDVETLVEEVSDIAYDKAVEVVTDTVRLETHKEDLRLVKETKNWVLSPERKAPQKEREYAARPVGWSDFKNQKRHAVCADKNPEETDAAGRSSRLVNSRFRKRPRNPFLLS